MVIDPGPTEGELISKCCPLDRDLDRVLEHLLLNHEPLRSSRRGRWMPSLMAPWKDWRSLWYKWRNSSWHGASYSPPRPGEWTPNYEELQPTEIRETILQSIRPVWFNAWVREAADKEAHLQMIKIDTPTPAPQASIASGKGKGSKLKMEVRDLCMKQGLCLQCGEAGHYANLLPRGRGSFSSSKSPGRKEAQHPTEEGIH
ncbi:UNVERIFIED_CONTAM: hypothetical protein K2H54_052291 [Gekko kuhli]